MKNISLLLSLLIVLSTVNVSLAGDNISISMSCTIPAIPGVNAPPFEEEAIQTELTKTEEEIKTLAGEDKTQTRIIAQEEKEMRLIEGEPALLNLQTIYSR